MVRTGMCVQTRANVPGIQADTCSHCPLQAWLSEAAVLWVTYALAAAQSCLAVSERNRGLRREPIPL
ncbi:Serine/threonine-protein kinase MEC1 [Clarias magur]|uniref:Serine/threonine-protein kinase MEC1 n=1 Tax=Clarias magur TaxID=1594786 RepID=A0A8J5C9A9_CLAMG|nr:Serine/threonine-protein kinase MEC1 [Clarias magur]